ncbi:MAG TPA: 2-oxoglutarate dehydrogenase complex dihydrolipoyllysine-residue succinyltransferase [Opitutaceae bacterium]|nr:2-oxoglutarate dehydrogenase complex dihydrolipoyllysine-residue succinyltransferase [Opitutaceae bacterium]
MPSLDVKIPPMGESISSGVLAKWHVKDGDVVKKDQPLFELETDKITSEGTAESAGKISLKVAVGAEVKIGQVVATIDTSAAASTGSAPAATPAPAAPAAATPASASASSDAAANKPAAPGATTDTPSPAVRRLAAETGIDPASVSGTGKGGRVTKGDMLAAGEAKPNVPAAPQATAAKPAAAESAAPAAPPVISTSAAATPAIERQTRRKLTPLRQRIAQRLVAAQHEAAMLTTFNEVDMSAVMALRSKYQDDFVKKNGLKLGFMSFFTKAVVNALKEVPAINAQIDGDHIVQNNYFDVGVAVSTEKGLMVPVIRDCDRLGMADIEKAIGNAAKKARDGKITLQDLEGGVFTITNGGIFGSMVSTPIINPPQSAILGLHAINDRPVAVNGQVVIRPMMYLALSYDHRIVDGKEAVTFLVKVKQAIEDPARLLLSI